MQNSRTPLVDIHDDETLRISARSAVSDSTSGSILLSFTGLGHAMGALNVQQPEFFGAGRSFDNILFITDKERSWGNNLDFDRIAETIAPLVGDRKVYTIGNSMGGFLAIAITRHVETVACVAFVPQFSVSSRVFPTERRWRQYRDQIKTYRLETIEGSFVPGTRYYLFSSLMDDDRKHAEKFPVASNILHYGFPTLDHRLSLRLKEQGHLEKVVSGSFGLADTLDIEPEHVVLSKMASN